MLNEIHPPTDSLITSAEHLMVQHLFESVNTNAAVFVLRDCHYKT